MGAVGVWVRVSSGGCGWVCRVSSVMTLTQQLVWVGARGVWVRVSSGGVRVCSRGVCGWCVEGVWVGAGGYARCVCGCG